MFELNPFYHAHIQRFVTAFGETFKGITVVKKADCSTKLQSYECPVEYAPRHKWLSRINEQPDFMAPQVQITLPRISFEIVGMRYAPERKIGVPGQYVIGDVGGKRGKIYNPVPYDLTIQLYTMTKDQNDAFRILEQILPFFQPTMTLNYEVLPEYQVKKDIPITILGEPTLEDTYEGSPEDKRTVIQTLSFNAKLDFFGPTVAGGSVIKDVIIDYHYDYSPTTTREYEAVVDPITANKDDDYTINETWSDL